MGGALLEGWLAAGVVSADAVRVADKLTGPEVAARLGVHACASVDAIAGAEVVVVAVKPQTIESALGDLPFVASQLVISVAAGVPAARLRALVAPARVIRTMPNLACGVRQGVTAVLAGPNEVAEDVERTLALFRAVGHAEPLADEGLFHAATALVGSGPAYLFVAMQAMADGAVAAGLPRDTARRLAAATVRGAGAVAVESDAHPEALKDAVASPGGTTIAALGILERCGYRGALFDAVHAAAERSKALAAATGGER
ncbi:MAG: pyrroline-5-carboxylate reductase [Myxococcales bacterium]|nr:pyrroline-5-carboxylate reductase [Myxococcales bacterium]